MATSTDVSLWAGIIIINCAERTSSIVVGLIILLISIIMRLIESKDNA